MALSLPLPSSLLKLPIFPEVTRYTLFAICLRQIALIQFLFQLLTHYSASNSDSLRRFFGNIREEGEQPKRSGFSFSVAEQLLGLNVAFRYSCHDRGASFQLKKITFPRITVVENGACCFNPLSPSIKLQILLLCFHTFLTEVVGRSC